MLLSMSHESDRMQATGHKFPKKFRRRSGDKSNRALTLVVVHYHLRPGGIRRVIEMALPHLCARLGNVKRVIVASGEAGAESWTENLRRLLRDYRVDFFVRPAFGYFSEQKISVPEIRAAAVRGLRELFDECFDSDVVVWAHNLGVGRNLILTDELTGACQRRNVPLISHHHDWWFDNRWGRWGDIQRSGFRTLPAVARTVFPAANVLRHAAINSPEAKILQQLDGDRSAWLPNLAGEEKPVPPAAKRAASQWLAKHLGEKSAPVWILPCRLLRRKNVAEALLLMRWLRPKAWLVTTGGPSSQDERAYYEKLASAAKENGWRLRLGILAGDESDKPGVASLMAASECVLLTSLQEGFGLPYIEAVTAKRPLIARSLPNLIADLSRFGFLFAQYYDEILIDPKLFDLKAERERQREKFAQWKSRLPRELQKSVPLPALLDKRKPSPRAFPFARLTLDAQLEILAQPLDRSWKLCAPLNPFLKRWKLKAAKQKLQVTAWPAAANRMLGGKFYAEKFARLLNGDDASLVDAKRAARVQLQFIQKKLAPENAYPLLWTSEV